MKRKFIFLVMLFALLGGVNWNVLNAQEPGIKIGEDKQDSSPTGMYPMYGSWYCSISQQIFTAAEIGGEAGNITSIAFKTSTAAKDHNITVWLLNTTNSTLNSPMAFGDSDKVFEGTWNSGAAGTWSQITLDRAFSYNGDNLVVILQENGTGSTDKFYKYTKGAGTTLQYKYASYVASLEGLSGYYTSTYNNVFGLTIESAVDEGLIPGVPTNLVASVVDHASVSLTWDVAENAQSYNVYKNGVLFKNVKTNSCLVDGLNAETTYEFTVTALNFSRESDLSNVATATTPVAPATRDVVFTLIDSYGDGWNGGTLSVSATDGTSQTLTHTSGKEATYTLNIAIDATVTVTFNAGSYAYEASYRINYDSNDGDEIVWSETNGKVSGSTTFYFTVEGTEPSVEVSENTIALGAVRMGNYWTEKTPVSETFNITSKNTTITGVSCSNTFFDVAYDETTGVVTVGYNKAANVTGEQTGIITIKANGVDDVTVGVSATAYVPVSPDVIELVQEVEFTAGAYENTPNFATLHDDYILPGEATEGSTPDAVYHFTMENEGILTVNVTGTNAIAAVYQAEEMDGSGPSSKNNYNGNLPVVSAGTTFRYDFNTDNLNDFTLIDEDNDGKCWELFSGYESYSEDDKWVISYSSTGGQNNIIVTNNKYSITETSELEFKIFAYSPEEIFGVAVSEDKINFTPVAESTYKYAYGEIIEVSLSDYANQDLYIALYHKNGDATYTYKLGIDYLQLTDGSARNRSAEPQINGVQYPAGEYYLVAAAENAFTVSIETGALPAPGVFAYTAPADGAKEQDNPVLTWEAAQYATEYKVYLGTESTLTEENLVATVTTPSYQTEGLSNNTQYFWKVDAVNAVGTTKGVVYSFVTPLDVPQNVTAANIFEGETATVTWDAIENVTYNVYVDETKVNVEPITTTSYELTDLAYNLSGYNVTVTANHTLGESPKSAAVNVKVGGKFTFVLNVKDTEGNAIEGATVTFNTEFFLNEFYQGIPAIEATTTDAEGKVSVELPLPCKYGEPDYQFSSFGAIVTKEFYTKKEAWIDSYTTIEQGGEYVTEVKLELAAPAALTAEDNVLAGDDLELSWDAVTGAIGYNVYKQGEWNDETNSYDYVQLNDEMITDTDYTVEDVEYGMWVEYAVTAVYAIGESGYTTTTVSVTGMGSVSGTVTDGAKPVKGVKVVLTGKDAFFKDQTYTYTTDANGEFTGKVMVGSYTATATRYDFEDYTSNEQVVVNYNETVSVNIAMTSYPSATITVIATDAGDNAVVNWTAEYEKYNVYRRNVETDAIEKLATETTSKQYTDAQWVSLDNGTYQYGVSAFVEEQQSRGGEIIFEEGFENEEYYKTPSGWEIIGNYSGGWYVYNAYKYSGEKALWSNYLMSGTYDILMPGSYNPSGTTLSFYHLNKEYQGTMDELVIYWTTSPEGTYDANNVLYTSSASSWTKAEISLNDINESSIYIVFRMNSVYADGIYIDDITITREASSAKESTITWSNELVKKSALTLTFNNAAGDNNWNNEANWAGGNLPTAEDNVVVNAEANITGTVAVNNLTINARLNVMPEATFTVNGTITDANEYGNLYIEDGAQIFQKNEGVNAYFRMNIINPEEWSSDNKAGWQFISSPLLRAEVTAAATKYDNAYQLKDYDMYKYNGSLENEWVNHKANYDFEAYFTEGRGYMYSHQARTIVTLGGTLNPATTFDYEVTYTEDKELANLHLLGNPFTFNMDWQYVNVSNVYDGYATLNAAGDDYVYATEGTIAVGDGFFVQAIGENPEIGYANVRGSKETSANINVIARGNAGEDNVIINFAGEGEGFRKLQGFNEDNARIFVENEGRRYGIANVEANATEVELSFVAAQMGNYTISLDVNGKFETVVLVDRFTGVETNMLLEDEYSFTATSNDSPNRFVVRLGGAKTESASFVYQSGEELILSIEGSVQIVDMLGRVVYSNEHASGDNRINVADFNDATYVVRVVNEEGVKTQKVVIY